MYLPVNDGPDTDQVVCEAAEQGLTISRPGQGDTFWLAGILANLNEVGLEFVDDGPD